MLKHNHTQDSLLSSSSPTGDSSAQAPTKPRLWAYQMPHQTRGALHPMANTAANTAAATGSMPRPIHQGNNSSGHRWAESGPHSVLDRQNNGPAKASDGNISQMQQMQQTQQMQQQSTLYLSQQKHLRQVERRLRSSLNPATIWGVTVVETAALFNARQVSLLRYYPTHQSWQQVAQFCKNQSLAWQKPIAIFQAEFPHLMQQLRQGRPLRLFSSKLSGQLSRLLTTPSDVVNASTLALSKDPSAPSSTGMLATETQLASETSQWMASWPGNWLLVPIKNRQHNHYSLSNALRNAVEHTVSDNSLSDNLANSTAIAGAQGSITDLNLEKHPHERTQNHKINQDHWGFMALALSEQEVWSASAIAAAQSITLELSLAMEQAHQYQELMVANQELQKLALSDGLTRLANRRRFDEHLNNEWQRLARDQQPLSLILCDLDHFKRYNDSYGHPAGDRCLIRVARALLNGPQRPADLVARYGGEEFAIILPNTDTQGAWRIAQKVHDSIRTLKIAHAPDHEEAYVTVTMGISTMVPGHDTTAQMLVQASDLALYHAKQQGRNRTYIHAHYTCSRQYHPSENGD